LDALDALIADGIPDPASRPGAELKAWSVVQGFASLTLDGALIMLDGALMPPAGPEREAVREAVLEFTVVGICSRNDV
jgi:hypothetical protein